MKERSGIEAAVEVTGAERRLQSESELVLYRVVEEALRNTSRHSDATNARISVEYREDTTRIAVVDNGKGFSRPKIVTDLVRDGRLGLASMEERVASARRPAGDRIAGRARNEHNRGAARVENLAPGQADGSDQNYRGKETKNMKRVFRFAPVMAIVMALAGVGIACTSSPKSTLDESAVRAYADPATETTLQGLKARRTWPSMSSTGAPHSKPL